VLSGRSLTVAARHDVLCCGGLENPLILLNIDRLHGGLLSRKTDAIGRYYSDHPEIRGRYFPLKCFVPALYQRFEDRPDGRMHHWTRMFLSLDPAAHPEFGDLPHAASIGSFHPQCQYGTAWDYEHLYDRIRQRDANFTVPSRKSRDEILRSESVVLQFAPTPHRESRISLSDRVDALGHAGVLDWRIHDADLGRIRRLARAIEQRLGANGLARVRLARVIEEHGLALPSGLVKNACHHMGGTRMAASPREGVVDSDCRMHGLDNVFIAGPGVFPSFDWPGPTYTAVALAIRLADHLRRIGT
jgi:choline dehydrogenase-like flavoprotein